MVEFTGRVIEAMNGVVNHIGELPASEVIIFLC